MLLGAIALAECAHRQSEAALKKVHKVRLALETAVGGDRRDCLVRRE